jgi:ATP-binding cassette subfamily F protein 3
MPPKSQQPQQQQQQQQQTAAEPVLQITAQQSRYAVDAVDAPTTNEILIKDLTISLGQRELLSRTTLHLCEGGRYVLVGRNGEGKSSMSSSILV